MIDVLAALEIAKSNFPGGPEALASHLDVAVVYAPLVGCDGWCVRSDRYAEICISDSVLQVRQRFTLAHELAHLILGTPPDISPLPSAEEYGNHEEEIVNHVAAEMLLPSSEVESRIHGIPVSLEDIKRIEREANVSVEVVFRRLVRLANQLGLRTAFFVSFNATNRMKFVVPKGSCSARKAEELLNLALKALNSPMSVNEGNCELYVIYRTTSFGKMMLCQSKANVTVPAEA